LHFHYQHQYQNQREVRQHHRDLRPVRGTILRSCNRHND
jgi:hypothetical protein